MQRNGALIMPSVKLTLRIHCTRGGPNTNSLLTLHSDSVLLYFNKQVVQLSIQPQALAPDADTLCGCLCLRLPLPLSDSALVLVALLQHNTYGNGPLTLTVAHCMTDRSAFPKSLAMLPYRDQTCCTICFPAPVDFAGRGLITLKYG